MTYMLNSTVLAEALKGAGISRDDLAGHLQVSSETVAGWESGATIPEPGQLLDLGLRLNVSCSELVSAQGKPDTRLVFPAGPQLFHDQARFRLAGDAAELLDGVAKRLTSKLPAKPLTLSGDCLDYDTIQNLANRLRKTVSMSPDAKLNVVHLAKMFKALRAVVVPVLWGECGTIANLLQICDDRNRLTWCYVNLDNTRHEVKKYLARHLGQILAAGLDEKAAQTFTEIFSRLLLFPASFSKTVYRELIGNSNYGSRYNRIVELAKEHFLPPMTICQAINDYATALNAEPLKIREVGGVDAKYNRRYQPMSGSLFGRDLPPASQFIQEASSTFETPFFTMLAREVSASQTPVGLVQLALQVTVMDAQAIAQALSRIDQPQGRRQGDKQRRPANSKAKPNSRPRSRRAQS